MELPAGFLQLPHCPQDIAIHGHAEDDHHEAGWPLQWLRQVQREEPDAPPCVDQLQHSGDDSLREQQDGASGMPSPMIAPCFLAIVAAPLAVAPALVAAMVTAGRAGSPRLGG